MTRVKSVLTSVEERDGTIIVHFQIERINDFALARQLGEELQVLVSRPGCRHIILDFHGLEYVISEVFGILLRLAREAHPRGCMVRACNLGRFFREVYETMRFQQVIPISESLEDALAK